MGFWRIAQEQPDKLCLVDPDGVEVTYGELLERANQFVHGLRALGLEAGDDVAAVLQNSTDFYALVFAATQAGWYFTPINHHLVGPEIAYIVNDCEAKALIVDERFAEACTVAAKELTLPADHRFSIGAVDGYRPIAELVAGQPTTLPEDRTAGAPMHYTSGTTGKPKGVRRALSGADPDDMAGR